MKLWDSLQSLYNFLCEIPTAIQNTPSFLGAVIIESVLCIVVGYSFYQCCKVFFISHNHNEATTQFSSIIDRLLISGGLYYFLRFINGYLMSTIK